MGKLFCIYTTMRKNFHIVIVRHQNPAVSRGLAKLKQKRSKEMSSNVTIDINAFFMNPSTAPVRPGTFSQLYLLRRDISTCFGIDPTTGQLLPTEALWPGVMAICAGIDLLGKFLAGNDARGRVGPRFRTFLTTYFGISENDAETIYQLRNSLLHSFGLYSEVTDRAGNVRRVYIFILAREGGALITALRGDTYLIDIETLRTEFENAITSYETQLRADATLQTGFANMFPKHRGLRIG